MLYDKIYDYILEQDKKEHTSPENTFSPSAIGKCRRQLYYSKTKAQVTNPISSPSLLKMKLGEAAHVVIQNYLRNMGVWVDGEELKESNLYGINFRYRYDGKLLLNNTQYICEIKSIYGNGFYRIEKEPDMDHVKQVLLYCLMEKIPNAILLYVGRDNGRLFEYNITINDNYVHIDHNGTSVKCDNLLSDIEITVRSLNKLFVDISNNNPPEKLEKFYVKFINDDYSFKFQKDKIDYDSDWRCSYCQYMDLCRKDEKEYAKENKFYIPVDKDLKK